MAAIGISETSLGLIKKALRNDFIDERSSHLTEALAAALGFQTHAALLADVARFAADPPVVLLDTERFIRRLESFGYPRDNEFDFEFLAGKSSPVISTVPATAFEYHYNTERKKAWRNLMVCAVNEGLRLKLFSVRPGDNRWPGSISGVPEVRDMRSGDHGHIFDFALPTGLPARGYVNDIGWSELCVHVAVNPKGSSVRAANAGFEAGDAFASSWLERERGAWLQSSEQLTCRKSLVSTLALMDVTPLGYGDKGAILM